MSGDLCSATSALPCLVSTTGGLFVVGPLFPSRSVCVCVVCAHTCARACVSLCVCVPARVRACVRVCPAPAVTPVKPPTFLWSLPRMGTPQGQGRRKVCEGGGWLVEPPKPQTAFRELRVPQPVRWVNECIAQVTTPASAEGCSSKCWLMQRLLSTHTLVHQIRHHRVC